MPRVFHQNPDGSGVAPQFACHARREGRAAEFAGDGHQKDRGGVDPEIALDEPDCRPQATHGEERWRRVVAVSGSIRLRTARTSSVFRGIIAPMRKAPNRACTPMDSLTSAEVSARRIIQASEPPVVNRRSSGLTKTTITMTYPTAPMKVSHAAVARSPARTLTTTKARQPHHRTRRIRARLSRAGYSTAIVRPGCAPEPGMP